MGKNIDIAGERFGRLTAIRKVEKAPGSKNRHSRWLCLCDCGKTTIVNVDKLRNGGTKSCGCLCREKSIETICKFNSRHTPNRRTHGKSNTKLYWAYRHMMERCYRKETANYKSYGGRGISICEEWRNKPDAFIEWALKNGYSEELTLDRIDVNGNYCPENCRWADWETQANNKTTSVFIDFNGERLTIAQFARKNNIPTATMWYRYKSGWTVNEMAKPVRRKSK